MTAANMWIGPDAAEARAAFRRAKSLGMTTLRSMVVGIVASFRDCWTFIKTIARELGCSPRTVQRALTQAELEGLIGKARAKKHETPPGLPTPLSCGFSHRWTIGRGKAGPELAALVNQQKLAVLVRRTMQTRTSPEMASYQARVERYRAEIERMRNRKPELEPPPAPPPAPRTPRRWTAEEIDAELERLERLKRPPE